MADLEKLNGTLQENIITLLAHDDLHGKVIANIINPALFEGDYRVIAERCVDYWKRHGQAPKFHTDDLVADVLEDKSNRRAQTYRRILGNMMELKDHINTGYVIEQITTFTRMQRFKDAIIKSAETLNRDQHIAVEEIEKLWNDLLRVREISFDPGLRLNQFETVLDYLENTVSEFVTGIREFDRWGVVPVRGQVMMFLAAAKRGKSWWLIHIAKLALMQRKRVVHISLENSAEETLQRYYQSFFAAPKDEEDEVVARTITRDEKGYLDDWHDEQVKPEFTMRDRNIREELEAHLGLLGTKVENLIVKRFPTRGIDMRGIEAYLDNLEIVEKFIPDMVVLDYAGILKTDSRNHRIDLGRQVEEFRAMCTRRNVAGVTAHQISRAGAEALHTSSTQVAEDWSIIGTCDKILAYSSTNAERRLGLGRIKVSESRGTRDNFGVIITQSYVSGQFVIDSALLDDRYFEMLDDLKEEMDGPVEDDDDSQE